LSGWSTERKLAEGAQARIFLVHWTEDAQRRPFAAKVLRLAAPEGRLGTVTEQRWRLLREVTILRSLAGAGCPNVPRVIAHGFATERSEEPWYVMPFYAGGAMKQLCNGEAQWAENYQGAISRVLGIAEEVALTLSVMHQRQCVHRDVNTSNVLFGTPGGKPVLADFGIAHWKGFPGGVAGERSAPWRWCPPELRAAGAEAAPAADVFMLGGLIVEALSGGSDLPDCAYWPEAELPERPERLLARYVADPRAGSVLELAGRMVSSDPNLRPSAREVAQACRGILRSASSSRRENE
jgi:serine/threonine protein kinase